MTNANYVGHVCNQSNMVIFKPASQSAEAPQTAYDDDQRRMEKLWEIGVLQVFLPEKRGLLNIQWLIVILYLVEFSIKWGGLWYIHFQR